MFNRMEQHAMALIDGCISLSYFMRGAIPYEQMLNTTPGERERIDKFINERLEKELKRQNPNY